MNGGISQDSRVMESVMRDLAEITKIADAEWAELDGRPMERIVQTELAAKRADPEWLAMVERDWSTGGEVT